MTIRAYVYKDGNALAYCTRCARMLVDNQGEVIEWDRTSRSRRRTYEEVVADPAVRHDHSMGAMVPGTAADCPVCALGVPHEAHQQAVLYDTESGLTERVTLPLGAVGRASTRTIPVKAAASTSVIAPYVGPRGGKSVAKQKRKAQKAARRRNR